MLVDLALLLAAAVIAVPITRRLGLGAVLGYLAAGIAIGPHGLGLISDVDRILGFSSFGVVLLLFVIGLELQPARLWRLRGMLLGSGGIQVAVTTLILAAIGLYALHLPWQVAAITAFGLAMSSTALVLQLLTEQGVLNTRAGRNAFAVLLFQDLAVIPVLALLAAPHGGGLAMLRGVIAAAVVMVGGRYLLRPVLRLLAAAQVPEVFTAAALLIVVAVSLGMESIGLSESLGAFLAGVLLADSEYRHEMQADIEPFKSLLMGLFFIAIGMSADFTVVAREPAVILALVAGLVAIKALVLLAVALGNGLRGRAALTFGLALAQGGEFAFVLFDIAGGRGLLPPDLHARLVVAVTLSMLLTPPLLMLVKRLGVGASEAPPYDELKAPEAPVLIAGFGPFGQIVARVLRVRRIPFTVLEKDWQHVDFVRRFGGGVFYSDATRLEVLRAARIGSARALVVAIAERTTSEFIVERVRGQYPNLRIFAVARDRQHEIALRRLGADFVIRRHLLSGLALVEQLLVLLGDRPERAQHTVATFADHDARTLSQQMDLGDENARIQTALQSARELEELFAADDEDEARKRRADAA